MPSTSLARRGRVVTEMDRVRLGSSSRRSRVSVVLPAPDGEESTSIRPRRPMMSFSSSAVMRGSLDILHLLAELLDLRLEVQPDDGEGGVVGLGAERVGLARKLLGQEVEAAPDRPALAQQLTRRAHMGPQPVDFLANIGLGGQQYGL